MNYSNHLNTEHLKSEHLTSQMLFCLGFKWSEHMIRRTIKKWDIFDLNRHFQTTMQKQDDLTPRHVPTILIPDLSGIQMVTVVCSTLHFKLKS